MRIFRRAALLLSLAAPLGAQTTLLEVPSSGAGTQGELIGDTDGDGRSEILVCNQFEANGALAGAGSASVHSGADGHLLYVLRGSGQLDHLGTCGSAAGDADGDGFADFCIGAPDADPRGRNSGLALLVSGHDGHVLFTFTGARNTEFFGTACAPMGDLDRDGRDDVLISAPSENILGVVRVFSGADGHELVRAVGSISAHRLGTGVSGVGDADGDGTLDFAAVQYDKVRVFSGASGAPLWQRQYLHMGGSLVISGGLDADGDGSGDVVIGTHMEGTFRGHVEVVSGRDGSLLREAFGDSQGNELGFSVRATGDLDGDGRGDFAVGIPNYSLTTSSGEGAIRAYSGRTGASLFTFAGHAADRYGFNLGGGGDLNADGYPDLVTGSALTPVQRVLSFVPRGLEPFGTGTSGCAGALHLLANGVPAVGNANFAVHLSGAGDSVTSLLTGDSADVPGTLRYGALFHLDPAPIPPALGILSRTQLPLPDALRSIVTPLPIPSQPALIGLTYYFQGVSLFTPGTCARRIATTPGLKLTFQ